MTAHPATDYYAYFTEKVLIDALTEATTGYWVHRATMFEQAAHHPGADWPGHATPTQLHAQQARCQETALACRHRAVITHLTRPGTPPTGTWP